MITLEKDDWEYVNHPHLCYYLFEVRRDPRMRLVTWVNGVQVGRSVSASEPVAVCTSLEAARAASRLLGI